MIKPVELASDSGTWTATVEGDRVTVEGVDEGYVVREAGTGRWSVDTPHGGRIFVTAVRSDDVVWIGIEGHALEFRLSSRSARPRSADRDQEALSPPMSATVVRIQVRPGDRVEPGDTLVVLEAMKMELPIRSPRAATVRAIHCSEGQLVQPGTVLIELGEP